MHLNESQPEPDSTTVTIPRDEYRRLRNDSLELLNRPVIPEEVFEDAHEQLGSCAVCGRTDLVWYAVAAAVFIDHERGEGKQVAFEALRLIWCWDCGALMTPDTYDAVKLMRAELLRQPIRRGGLPL